MRTLMFLGLAGVALVAAGVISVQYNKDGSATVKVNKEVARERASQLLDEAKALEAQLEKNVQSSSQTR